MGRRPWATPFATTRPAFVALVALVALGMAAVLGGAAIRAHEDPSFRPDWAVWAPVTVGIGLGLLGMASLALLAQRLPPAPMNPAGPLPRPLAEGTERALLRGEPLTPGQAASLPDLVARVADRRQLVGLALGPVYLVGGGLALAFGNDHSFGLIYGGGGLAWSVAGGFQLRRRRRILDRAADLGVRPRSASTT